MSRHELYQRCDLHFDYGSPHIAQSSWQDGRKHLESKFWFYQTTDEITTKKLLFSSDVLNL